jgi:hypothetical protein
MSRTTHREFIRLIPDDLRLFEVADIERMFSYMEETFKLSSKWRLEFQKQLAKSPRGIPEQEYFFGFLKEHVQPSLQVITQREDILFAMARYLIKDRIEEKRKEEESRHKFYRSR